MSSATREKSRARRRRRAHERDALATTQRLQRARSNRSFLKNAERWGQQQAFPEHHAVASKADLINSMTNWQRTQCLKACKGDPKTMDVEEVRKFTVLQRPKS